MNKTEIIVCGAAGKMGSLIIQLAVNKKDEFVVKGGVESETHPLTGKVNQYGIPVSGSLKDIITEDVVVIDFSIPEAATKHVKICKEIRIPFVTGITGFNKEQMELLKEASSFIPVFYSPNMSIGVNLFFEIVRFSTKLLRDYEVEITEIHHNLKKDAPSGTARKLAEIICNVLNIEPDNVIKYGRKGITGSRTREEIGIHSLRLGDIVGEHYVYFGGKGEIIEISHRCYNREAFASGALKAAQFVKDKEPGFYTMEHLIKGVINV